MAEDIGSMDPSEIAEAFSAVKDQVIDAVQEARERLEIDRRMRESPWVVLGIAAGAGFVLGGGLWPALRPVVNATGVILHTNLGRAPLSDATIKAMNAVAANYSTLEYDLNKGQRGSRLSHAESVLQKLLSVEAAVVVNNNASAVLLVLSALASKKRVVISRTQLVEIGGGFRVPDVMKQSNLKLLGHSSSLASSQT